MLLYIGFFWAPVSQSLVYYHHIMHYLNLVNFFSALNIGHLKLLPFLEIFKHSRRYLFHFLSGLLTNCDQMSHNFHPPFSFITDYLVMKCGVLMMSLFVFFTTTMSVSFTLRETQTRMLKFTGMLYLIFLSGVSCGASTSVYARITFCCSFL